LPVREQSTKIETKINGYDYLQTYIDGYKEGEQYFDDEFRISPNTLYGENAEDYVKDIHYNFFNVRIEVGEGHEGWAFVKEAFSLLLTKKSIKEYGYYSGIVSKVEEQVKKYPRLFKKFEKIYDLPALQTKKEETAPPDENIKNQFNTMLIEEVRKHFKPLIEIKKPNGEMWMTEGDFEIFMKRSFGGQTELPKPKINIGGTGKYAVVKLFYQFYSKSTDHPHNGNRKKDPFVKLLKDAFVNSDFNDLTNDNFKGDKHKHEWD
jgi:hypothetical protein